MIKSVKIMAVMILFGCAVSSNAALVLTWGYSGNLVVPIPSVTAGWVVQMYQDVGVDTVLSSVTGFNPSYIPQGTGTSTDQLLGSFQTTVAAGKAGTFSFGIVGMTGDAIAGLSVYTVLFNNAVLSSATQAWIIDTAPTTLAASGTASYIANSVTSTVGYGPIAVVPEPSSIALIGIGLVAIGLRRRFVK